MKAGAKSPHASSRRRSSSKEVSPPMTPDPLLLAQLQQLQLAQQLQQHGHLLNYPPMVYPAPTMTGSRPPMEEPAPSALILQQLEAKESRMAQLSALLEAVKHESSGTTEAMQRMLHELQTLQQTNASLTSELGSAKEALVAQDANHSAQLQHMLRAVDDERRDAQARFDATLQEREGAYGAARHALECEVAALRSDKAELSTEVAQLQTHCNALQEAHLALESQLQAAMHDSDLAKDELESYRANMNLKLHDVEAEKQELAQHLSATFQDLERARAALVDVNNNAAQLSASLAQNDQSWQRTLESFERQRADDAKERAAQATTIKALEDALQMERGQKEELNTAMRSELQRYSDEMLALDAQHSSIAHSLRSELETSQACLVQAKAELATLHDEATRQATAHTEAARQLEKTLSLKSEALEAYAESNQSLQTEVDAANLRLASLSSELDTAHFARRTVDDRLCALTSTLKQLVALLELNASTVENDPTLILPAVSELATLASERHQLLNALQTQQAQQLADVAAWATEKEQLAAQVAAKESELSSVQLDCATLASELQSRAAAQANEVTTITQTCEAKVMALETALQAATLQTMQLSRSVETQKQRMHQLEDEKRDLLQAFLMATLQEADQLNRNLESMFQGKNHLQLEVDTLRDKLATTQAELGDVSDSLAQMQATSVADYDDLRTRAAGLEHQLQSERLQFEHELTTKTQQLAAVEADISRFQAQLQSVQSELEAAREHLIEMNAAVEGQAQALAEANEAAAEWKDKADALTAATVNVEGTLKHEVASYSSQCVTLSGEKKRLEVELSGLQSQVDQLQSDVQGLRNEKRSLQQSLQDRDEALLSAQSDEAQAKAELDRLTRTKQSMQSELGRMNDEVNDHMRQLEVLRREFRLQEKGFAAREEALRKDAESLRQEAMEASALNDELQAKMTTIQAAANATINDLVAELTHAEEAVRAEKASRAKEDDLLRTQYRYLEEDMKRKEAEWRESATILKRESVLRKEHIESLEAKCAKQKEALESKKNDVDKITKDADQKHFRIAELERKLAPLLNTKETLTQRVADLKQTLEAKTRESQELEERLRADVAKLQKEKRDLEASRARHEDETDRDSLGRFATLQATLTSENKALKAHIERYKSDLQDASQNVLTLAQRLDALQANSNRTIAELSAELQTSSQQYEAQVSALQRDLSLANDHVADANMTRQLLQKEIRRLSKATDDNLFSVRTSASQPETRHLVAEEHDAPQTSRPSSDPFDARESLSDIPVALLRAQIGLDLSKPSKGSNNSNNNQVEGVPYLDLDQLAKSSQSVSMPALGLSSERFDADALPEDAVSASKGPAKKTKHLKLLKSKTRSRPSLDALPKLV